MKKIQAIKVRIVIFIVLIILAVCLAVPTHKKLMSLADGVVGNFSELIEDKTGLILSYSSLSPSVLSTFSIQNIELSEKNGNVILSINKTKISYSLLELLRKNIQKGIKNITIDGITIDVAKLTEIINLLFKNQLQPNFDYKTIKTQIPGLIKLKNISLRYNDKTFESELLFKEISLNNNAKKENLVFNLDSKVYVNLLNLSKKITGSLIVNGTIPDELENSLVYFKFDNLTDGNYKLSKLNLMAAYSDGKIELQTIQTVNPISITASCNINDGAVEALLQTDRLSPSTILSSNQKQLKQLQNLQINTKTELHGNVNDKIFNYLSSGDVFVPENIFPNGLHASYSIVGDEEQIDLENFTIEGQNCAMDMNLSYVFKTMQASGFAQLPYFVLPNRNVISTELYFDPLERGFMAFSPQVFLGNKALTALQFSFLPQQDSYDFVFEAYDYSHSDSAEPAVFTLDGSFLNNYIQGGVSMNSFYLDSIVDFALQLVDLPTAEKIQPVKKAISDFIFTGDIYLSTDLKSVSYNVPYLLLANTKKDNQFIMMALNGNEQSIQLNQLSLISGKLAVEASASLDRNPDTSDMFFIADLNAGAVPYHFSGSVMPEVITVTGDYGTDMEIRFGHNKECSGHAYFEDFPFSYDGKSIVFSAETDFNYDLENGPVVSIKHMDVEGANASFSVNPKLLLSGNVTKYGAQIDSIAYTDYYSALEGTADVMVNVNDGIFDSVGLIMNVKNPLSEEAIAMDATVSNPEHLKLDAANLLESLYINSQIQISSFSLNRFTNLKNDNNLLSASLFASGTVLHPYVALSIDEFSVLLAGNFLKTWGSITLEDKQLAINNFNIDFQMIKMDDLTGSFSLDTFEGMATGSIDTDVAGKNIHIPLELSVSETQKRPGKLLPDSTLITLSSKEIDGSFVKKSFGFDVSALYAGNSISLFSSDNLGLFGTVDKDGSIMMSVNSGDNFSFKVTGIANKNETNVKIGDFTADIKKVCSYFEMEDFLKVEKGVLNGSVSILNSFNDPLLKGAMMIVEPEIILPTVIPQKISTQKTLITVINNEIRVHETEYFVHGSNSANVGCIVYMNKWNVDHMEASVKTQKTEPVSIKMVTPAVSVSGDIICNLKLYLENENMELTGNIAGENVNVVSNISSISSANINENPSITNVRADLDIVLGNHATVIFDPLLRCVFVPNTHLAIRMDQEANLYEIDGELKVKSGDIAYLNRSFYIKEGNIKFNKTELANPQLTITAETRERDEDGQNVRIILSAENQYLLNFNPKFSSVPAKSENEILTLLGQIVVADSNTAANFLFAAGDYALQSAVVRKAENKLREVLNFDIFSMRTNVLQNTLNLGVSGNLSKETFTIGNFLDNSTVYVGKYLGSSLYLDAMIRVTFENTYATGLSAGDLMFQPEFGLEMESPFGNIRWNMAPNINALMNNQFVPSTSVTLSWKFAF